MIMGDADTLDICSSCGETKCGTCGGCHNTSCSSYTTCNPPAPPPAEGEGDEKEENAAAVI